MRIAKGKAETEAKLAKDKADREAKESDLQKQHDVAMQPSKDANEDQRRAVQGKIADVSVED